MADEIAPEKPTFTELAAPEDPFDLKRPSAQAAAYTSILTPTDSVLRQKGGVGTLEIYKELLRDDQVTAAWSQRRLALTSCETIVEDGADDPLSKAAAEAMRGELARLMWDDITDKQLYGVFYGWGIAECMWRPATEPGLSVSFDRIIVRDRARFRFGRKGEIYLWESPSGWVEMPAQKFWKVSAGSDNHDEPYGLGLAHQLYWPVFFKRSDIKYWLIFLEKFGMPTAVAKLPAGTAVGEDAESARQRGKALAMLRQIATDAGVVMPDNVTVELLEAARSGAADYKTLHDAMNAAISKIIIGQTATTEGTPGRLGSDKTQQGVAQMIVEADSDLLCSSFNAGPVTWWTQWNFPGAVPPKVYRQTEPAEDLVKTAETDKKVSELGFEPDESYIQKKYGPHWKRKAPAVVPPALVGPDDGETDPAQFAEGEAAALSALRESNRADQQELLDQARMFAEQYPTIMGQRIGQLLKAADFAEDPQVFRMALNEILADAPPLATTQKLARAGFFARLLGQFRTQRGA